MSKETEEKDCKEKIKEQVEKAVEKSAARKSEYVVSIIINLVLVWIFGRLTGWLPFLTDSFAAVLPLFYISFVATIIANFIFLFYDNRFFKGLVKALLNVFSIIVMITLYYVFPFDFSGYQLNWELIVRILLIVGIFGTAIGTLFELIGAFSKAPCRK